MIQKDKGDGAFLSIASEDSVDLGEKDAGSKGTMSLISAFAERLRSLWNNSDNAK